MRTTVDLPEEVLAQVKELAAERSSSVSATIADLTVRGLDEARGPMKIAYDERTGFPLARFGRPVTVADIAAALDDE